MRSDDALLIDIVEHARLVRDKMTGLPREAFDADRFLQLGLVHAIQIIGEASRALPPSSRDRFPSVPWKQIVGMRHRLVHEYFHVDLDRIWISASRDVPELLAALEPLVQPLIDARVAASKGKQQP